MIWKRKILEKRMATFSAVQRVTNIDQIFEDLYQKIVRLELLPGSKLSETDVAKTYGCSRQPVREAFMRLANLNLLLIRPQRATIVRHFSKEIISNARFTRAAIELEVVRSAVEDRDKSIDADISANMKQQEKAISAEDADAFHSLDYDFHRLLCLSAKRGFAFDLIAANKAQVDRLCMLSLTNKEAMENLVNDHHVLVSAIHSNDKAAAEQILRTHLDRLSPTIDAVYVTHRDYFSE